MRPKPKRNPMPVDVRIRVLNRAQDRCEGCSERLNAAWECHHRKTRGMGGSLLPEAHSLVNLLALCQRCHAACTRGEQWTWDAGLRVKQYADPADIPVLYRGRRLLFLTDDGNLEEAA